jgi:hypothetical protein
MDGLSSSREAGLDGGLFLHVSANSIAFANGNLFCVFAVHVSHPALLSQVTHLMTPSLLYNFDASSFTLKIVEDIAAAQLASGLVPDIAPEYVVFEGGFRDSPEWGSALLQLPGERAARPCTTCPSPQYICQAACLTSLARR